MKSALLGIVLGLVAATLGCSVTHRSGDFACTKTSDCASGRECMDGFCIVVGSIDAATRIDAPRMGIDGNNCPAGCTSCNLAQRTCTIDCNLTSCTAAVACPAGYHCDIKCDADNSCRNGVSCVGGASCIVECSGNSACRNVQCGTGRCDVTCTGPSSCRDISCGNSCACDVACSGSSSCMGTIQCTSLACDSGLGCSSLGVTCHSCP